MAFTFEAEIIGGELTLSDETTEIVYFSVKELDAVDLMEHHLPRILDAAENQEKTFLK